MYTCRRISYQAPGGSSAGFSIVGPTKAKARKSFLFTEGSLRVANNYLNEICYPLTHFTHRGTIGPDCRDILIIVGMECTLAGEYNKNFYFDVVWLFCPVYILLLQLIARAKMALILASTKSYLLGIFSINEGVRYKEDLMFDSLTCQKFRKFPLKKFLCGFFRIFG